MHNPIEDGVDQLRMDLQREINSSPADRPALEARYGRVWDTEGLRRDFEVHGFAAPFVVVTRKSDGRKGCLCFQHMPRFYFDFVVGD